MNTFNSIIQYKKIADELNDISETSINYGIMYYFFEKYNNNYIYNDNNEEINKVIKILNKYDFSINIENIITFFEYLLKFKTVDTNGIVFTPKYISDYIVEETLSTLTSWDKNITILDPACGCGIFLVSAIEYIHNKFNISITELVNNNIFGADINNINIKRCHIIIKILAFKYGENIDEIDKIICIDSLRIDWDKVFNVSTFKYIIGNPPYINTSNMSKEIIEYLKRNYVTTHKGKFNIFYAFIEKSIKYLSNDGLLGFIIPNNFMTIKSALELREYLQNKKLMRTIIDFTTNLIFKPILTYNCIIFIDKSSKTELSYSIINKTNNIKEKLKNLNFIQLDINNLDKSGWKLVDNITLKNLEKIENQEISLNNFIKTGIATLKDNIYFVDFDIKNNKYFKIYNNKKYLLEKDLVKPIYKISNLKTNEDTNSNKYIIFPYEKSNSGYSLIDECKLCKNYPNIYNYLLECKPELDSRDNGKANPYGWYAYGRTQGIKNYGKKLIFPTFSNKPKFIYIDNEDALFCNGYAIFENDKFDIKFISKILNSYILDYYIKNTSYSIEGNYYCYQKKYLKNFSIPLFTDDEIKFINKCNDIELNKFLIKKYDLKI